VLFVVVFFPGMLMAGLLPPHSPQEGARQIAEASATNPEIRRFGIFLCVIAAGLGAPLAAVISTYLKKVDRAGTYSNLQLIGGATAVVAILVPMFIWAAAAFRPGERPDEIILALNDLAWLPFVMNFPPALMQCLAIGFAVLGDHRELPVFPRWVGYYNLWSAAMFLPGGLVIFFHTGPFAWNGLLAFWLVAVLFGAWFFVMTWVMLKAIKQDQAQPSEVVAGAV
jgi:hypothetical protein